MMNRWRVGVAVLAFGTLIAAGCTGGKEGNAAEEPVPQKNPIAAQALQPPRVDPRKELQDISHAIPVYAGAQYRDDLTRRDEVMIHNLYGSQAKVMTLATNDSYPQVYHYYTTYLAQFRAFPVRNPYPPDQQNWRTLEIRLNDAMQDPFIPGDAIAPDAGRVILQVAETEAEPKTVIRYIITPRAVAAQTAENHAATAVAAATASPAPATRTPSAAVR